MSQDNELRRLEQFVDKLLARFNDLRQEKGQLQEKLRQRETEIGELRLSLAAREEERSEIGQRVGKMVEQIEEWEAALGGEGKGAVAAVVENVAEEEELVEREHSPQPVTESRPEEEGRVQHNLFSLGAVSR